MGLLRLLPSISRTKPAFFQALANLKTYRAFFYLQATVPELCCSRFHKFHSSARLNATLPIRVPTFPESISEGDLCWKKVAGDLVETDEVIAEIETDKTSLPVMSPCTGVLMELLVEEGEKVVFNQEIAKVDESTIETKHKTPVSTPKRQAPLAASQSTFSKPQTSSVKGLKPLMTPMVGSSLRSEQRIKITRIRQRTSDRLKEAQNTCATLTTFNEIDMSNLIDLRTQFKDAFVKRHGVKLGLMSTFSKAAAFALHDQPIVNAYIDGKEIVYRNYVDISIAVASPKGLVVPVLRNVESMNFVDIERGVFELGEKAKSGQLAVEDMDGGTFTISNGGIFGSLFSTPIINPPQSAILGLHGTFDRPVVRNNQVVIRPMMYVALSYDHRLIDGREAVLFLRKIKSFVEDPRVFFLDL